MTARIRLEVDGQWWTGENGKLRVRVPQSRQPYIEVRVDVIGPHRVDLDANDVVEAIIGAIKEAPDSFAAAGEWITAITHAATGAIREEDKP